MKRITGADNGAFKHIQRSKKAGGPVTFIIMRHRPASTFFHRQPWLGSVQRLDLRLFINTQHHGFFRRIQIEADHIRQLFNKLFVPGQLECLGTMWLQPISIPDSCNAGVTHAHFFRHRSGTPLSRSRRFRLERCLNNRFHFLRVQTLGAWTMRSIFRQSQNPLFMKSLAPQQNCWTRGAQFFGNGVIGSSLCGKQAYPGPQNHSLWRGSRSHPFLKNFSLFYLHLQSIGWFPHAPNYNTTYLYCKDITDTLH